MSKFEIPHHPSDNLWDKNVRKGYEAFWGDQFKELRYVPGPFRHGWLLGFARAYGMGVKCSSMGNGCKNPFTDSSALAGNCAAFAWRQGFNDAHILDGEVE